MLFGVEPGQGRALVLEPPAAATARRHIAVSMATWGEAKARSH